MEIRVNVRFHCDENYHAWATVTGVYITVFELNVEDDEREK